MKIGKGEANLGVRINKNNFLQGDKIIATVSMDLTQCKMGLKHIEFVLERKQKMKFGMMESHT